MGSAWGSLTTFFALGASLFSIGSTSFSISTPPLKEDPVSTTSLKALADPSEEPYFCSIEGTETGILSDIAALLGQESKKTIEMLPVTTYAEYQAHLQAKDYDLLLNASDLFSSTLLSGYDLTESYLSVSYSKAMLLNNTKSVTGIACLGDNSMAGVYAHSFYYASQVTAYDTMNEALNAVKNQDCYAAIINSIYAQKLQNEDIRSIYSFTKLSEGSLKLKIAVKHAEDGVLLKTLNTAIASISEDRFNAIVSRYSHFVKPTPTLLDQIYLNPLPYALGGGSLFLVLLAVIFILFYSSRRKAMVLANREFERFITYVCQTNEAAFEVNLQTRRMNHYQMDGGQVKKVEQSFSFEHNFLNQVHPDEKAMVEQEMSEEVLRDLIAKGGEKAFEARLSEGNGIYFWCYIIVQGILPSRAQPANFMVFIRSIDEQKQKDAHAKALLQNAVDQAETAIGILQKSQKGPRLFRAGLNGQSHAMGLGVDPAFAEGGEHHGIAGVLLVGGDHPDVGRDHRGMEFRGQIDDPLGFPDPLRIVFGDLETIAAHIAAEGADLEPRFAQSLFHFGFVIRGERGRRKETCGRINLNPLELKGFRLMKRAKQIRGLEAVRNHTDFHLLRLLTNHALPSERLGLREQNRVTEGHRVRGLLGVKWRFAAGEKSQNFLEQNRKKVGSDRTIDLLVVPFQINGEGQWIGVKQTRLFPLLKTNAKGGLARKRLTENIKGFLMEGGDDHFDLMDNILLNASPPAHGHQAFGVFDRAEFTGIAESRAGKDRGFIAGRQIEDFSCFFGIGSKGFIDETRFGKRENFPGISEMFFRIGRG